MQIVDSHCHINFDELHKRLPDILANAKLNEVSHMLCVSVNLEDYPQVKALADEYSHIFASVGVHPCYEDVREPSAEELVEIGQDDNIVAIGETGLDYFRIEDQDMTWQRDRFKRHISAAKTLNKPLIIHTRSAAEDTMRILKEEGADQCRGVMHCFAEDWEVAKQALDLGFYISLSGIVTFKSATNVQEVARKCPIDRVLVETDSPYLAPVPLRGKMNEPANVRHTAQFVADLRGISLEDLAAQTTDNFFELFPAKR
ncbi:TatD family hydrolase [Arenicella xantha]|uniref:TatD DNase family protein n=1 Tax=Arenicella xantha TaxID=644221 RepID=A0A395JF87_9GAMM|nr:TatD family hydrolase [Arenicella xantha]RBP48409.1 TatD DNase family protein [Arenicella xantha]